MAAFTMPVSLPVSRVFVTAAPNSAPSFMWDLSGRDVNRGRCIKMYKVVLERKVFCLKGVSIRQ